MAEKSALLNGSSTTVQSVYGLGVLVPKTEPCGDLIKPFKVDKMISTIKIKDDAGHISPPAVPSPPEVDSSWDGKEAAGDSPDQKRKSIRSVWGSPPQPRDGYANAWISAMGWTDFTTVTRSPSRLLDRFDDLVRGTPLIS